MKRRWMKFKRWLIIVLIVLAAGAFVAMGAFSTWLFFATYEQQRG